MDLGFLHSLFISIEYNYSNNSRITAAVNDDTNPDIVKYMPVNIEKDEDVGVYVNYNYSGKKYSATFDAGMIFPFVDIPYLNTNRQLRKPYWYFNTHNEYNISKNILIFSEIEYGSEGIDLMTEYGQVFNFSSGIRVDFFNKKLLTSIEVNDAFNTSDMVWDDKYGNLQSGQSPDYDMRYLRISLRYIFNNYKNIFRTKSGNQEEINRL